MNDVLDHEQSVSLAPGRRLQWEPAQRSHVLLYPEGMVTLSDTANAILRHCDGRTIAELIDTLRQQYQDTDLEEDVLEFLETARAESWLEFH